MKKKYTVFISSTYIDLVEERHKVIDVVLQSDCIPVGMEYFNAADDEQFAIIKRLIDDCDYYVLIIGGRYGSSHPETKISYTEMEYDYAVTMGIPVLVFEHSNVASLPDSKKDSDKALLEKLEAFKKKARSSRMAKMWDTHEKLLVGVMGSLFNAKNDYDRPGWTRGTNATHDVLPEEEVNINELKKFNLKYGYLIQYPQTGNWKKGSINATMDEIFEQISIVTHESISFGEIGQVFLELAKSLTKPSSPYRISVSDIEIAKIISQIIAFGLLEPCEKDGKPLFRLTDKGLEMRNKLVVSK